MNVLVVEDDPSVAEAVAHGLGRFGMVATTVGTAAEALDPATFAAADTIVLDLGLPDLDGYEVCRRIRRTSDVPILVMSGRGEEMDRVLGLELGADDYIVKPVGFHELVARIRAVNRRRHPVPPGGDATPAAIPRAADPTALAPEQPTQSESRTAGRLVIDPTTHRATLDGRQLTLTVKEFDLLLLLSSNPDAALHRDALIRAVWGQDYVGSTKTLDTHVSVLRRKLAMPGCIESVRGVGFRWVEPE